VGDKLVVGFQVYVLAPEAVRATPPAPGQMVGLDGVTVTIGRAFTFIVPAVLIESLQLSCTVTV
jgi:hypothetical protein